MLGGDGDLQSYNLFAYCKNNPSSYVDQSGLWAAYIGVSLDAAAGVKAGVSFSVIFDDNKNVGVMVTIALGGGTPTASVSGIVGFTNADTIFDMQGYGFAVGGSFGFGVEAPIGTSQNGDTVGGVQISWGPPGLSSPFPEMHGELTYSYIITYDRLPTKVQRIVDTVLAEYKPEFDQSYLVK